MRKRKISLLLAVAIIFTLINLLAVAIVALTSYTAFTELADRQSAKFLDLGFERTAIFFDELLHDALRLNMINRENIIFNKLYGADNLSELEVYLRANTELIGQEYQQVAVLSYGDEDGRYLGFRINPDASINLMLKDKRTTDKLVIYEGDRMGTAVVSVFDDYVTQDRPWYQPVKANPVNQWSDIYINHSEKEDMTITAMSPIIVDGNFYGISAIDVSLALLDEYLQTDDMSANNIVYIVDKNRQIIAQSLTSSSASYGVMALESSEAVIANSMRTILEENLANDKFVFLADGEKYYAYVGELDRPDNLGLSAVIIIPETEIMADMRAQQSKALATIAVSLAMSVILAMILVVVMLSPVKKVADLARLLSVSKFQYDGEINEDDFNIKETYELVQAFNHMTRELKEAFALIKANEEKLESKIAEKSLALEETYQELLESEKLASLGGLVAGVSHEVNTPIGNAVAACSYIVQEKDKLFQNIETGRLSKSELVEFLENIEESTEILEVNLDRAAEIISSFKQISVNQTSAIRTNFRLKEYLESIFLALTHEYKNKSFKYEVIADEDLELDSYPGSISHVFTNLIINSLKHGFIEGQELVIRISAREENDDVIMIFGDNGAGIHPDYVKLIFDPFFTTTRKDGGSGLGLSIVYNIVTANLGGTISCQSAINEGTVFTITIPKVNPHIADS